jgi:AraC-like DNA-binding protein
MRWAFARLAGNYERELEIAKEAGWDISQLGDPDGRIPTILARQLLLATIEKLNDPALGIHAGERIASSDFAVMGLAMNNCPDLRRAFLCMARYLRLLDDNVEGVLLEERDRGVWQIQNLIPRPLAAVNDFQVTVALATTTYLTGRKESPIEVHVRHGPTTYDDEYTRVFAAPVRFNAEHNALVLPRSLLDAPVQQANTDFFAVFDRQAQRGLDQLNLSEGMRARVQHFLAKRLAEGNTGVANAARELHMSSSTLRRRLAEEGTTYSDVLEEVRRELALHHVHDRRLTVGEIAFLLGFASQSAFGKAFRRWSGTSPLAYRAQLPLAGRQP